MKIVYLLLYLAANEHAMEAQTYVAKLYISASDDANAQAAVDKLVTEFAKEEKFAEVVEELAQEYAKASKHDKASELYRRIAEMWPDRDKAIWAQVAAVRSRIRGWDLDGAEGELGTLLVRFADDKRLGEAVHEIVEEYRNAGAHEESRELFNYLLAEWSASGETMLELQVGVALQSIKLGELEKADAAVDKLITDYNDSPKIGKALFQIAEEHLLAKNYQKALTLWEVIVSNYPDSQFETKSEIPFMLARCHYHLKDYPTAIEYFKRTVEELPGTKYAGWSSFYLGAAYRQEGNYEKALEYYQKVAAGWPDLSREWRAHYMIGRCYEHLRAQGVIGKEEGHALIRAAYEQVIAEDPNSEAANGAREWLRFNVKSEGELEGTENE